MYIIMHIQLNIVVSQKSAHGWKALQVNQRGGVGTRLCGGI